MKARVLFLLLALLPGSCSDGHRNETARVFAAWTGGEPARGRRAIDHYGCGTCHEIGGVAGANGRVGPPLSTLVERSYIGGVLANTPENLVRWIQNPQAVDSLTAMPNLRVGERDARDIASFLYLQR